MYREYRPPAPLSHIVDCVWTRTADADAPTHVVLPDGAMDLLATFEPDGALDETLTVGAMTTPHRVAPSRHAYLGVRFLPGAGGSALGVHAAELRDATCARTHSGPRSRGVTDALYTLSATPSSARALQRLLDAVASRRREVSPAVLAATDRFARDPARATVAAVARDSGVSRQQLARLFARDVGLSPKQFARVCRVRGVLAATREHFDGWSRTAMTWGYADQSHLIADVRAVTGCTPAEWRDASVARPAVARVATVQRA